MEDYFANPRQKPDDNWIPRRTTTDYGAFIAEDGSPGPQGPTGERGPQGITHALSQGGLGGTGPRGATGPNGATGPRGPAGVTGLMGPRGATGPMGSTGPRGATGPMGSTGPIGSEGPTGPIGPTGPKGSFVKTDLGIYEFACIEGTRSWFADIIPTGAQLRDKFAAAVTSPVHRFKSSDGEFELVLGIRHEFPSFDMPEKTEEQRLRSVAFWNQEYK